MRLRRPLYADSARGKIAGIGGYYTKNGVARLSRPRRITAPRTPAQIAQQDRMRAARAAFAAQGGGTNAEWVAFFQSWP